ncbi:hypothetical protein GCM10025770_23650 [Viridibacterium curvum]|uniref:DUF4136 domain-containing protein n=1 Tax=Viridibacterium curvum TaxID=1101404 RepID=A0ABP9QS65_9RHOO
MYVIVLVLAGCVSMPLPPDLSDSELHALAQAQPAALRVAITECRQSKTGEPYAPFADEHCQNLIPKVSALLKKTGLVGAVSESDQTADLSILIHETPRRIYWSTAGHNPGIALFGLAIPIWWADRFGYHLSLTDRKTGQRIELNSLREGTSIQGSWGTLTGMLPGRTLSPVKMDEAEVARIKLALLQLLEARQ